MLYEDRRETQELDTAGFEEAAKDPDLFTRLFGSPERGSLELPAAGSGETFAGPNNRAELAEQMPANPMSVDLAAAKATEVVVVSSAESLEARAGQGAPDAHPASVAEPNIADVLGAALKAMGEDLVDSSEDGASQEASTALVKTECCDKSATALAAAPSPRPPRQLDHQSFGMALFVIHVHVVRILLCISCCCGVEVFLTCACAVAAQGACAAVHDVLRDAVQCGVWLRCVPLLFLAQGACAATRSGEGLAEGRGLSAATAAAAALAVNGSAIGLESAPLGRRVGKHSSHASYACGPSRRLLRNTARRQGKWQRLSLRMPRGAPAGRVVQRGPPSRGRWETRGRQCRKQ